MNFSTEFILVLVTFVTIFNSVDSEIIRIENGEIEGTVMQTRYGENFHAFLGIPFAEAPVGDLRFKAPVPKNSWSGVLNCTTNGPRCMQSLMLGTAFMSEDCLQLNVFTKNFPSDSSGLKPVIAFIHGGAFEIGSAVSHGPDYLMERDIVLVTINYRLAIFGFMALGTEDVPGNAGLKDQNLALRWIQNNIRFFGGDPNKVTVTGSSAGAHSASSHMISPMSKGLVHNMIAMSGALAWQKKLASNNIDAVKNVATELDCSTENLETMLSCLRNTPAETIARTQVAPSNGCPIMTWVPVVEEKDFGNERFLIEDPNVSLREGRFENVSLMIGITIDEFISPVSSILASEASTKAINENFEEFAPMCFFFESNEFRSAAEIARALRAFYLPFDVIDGRSFNSLNQLVADGVIGNGVHRLVHYVTESIPVYYFMFSFAGPNSMFRFPRNSPYGVHHGDDLQYIFRSQMMPLINLDDPENVVVQRMTRMWENFAWTGNPNNGSDPFLSNMVWPQHDLINEHYLEIGNNLVEKRGLYLNRFAIWDRLEKSSSGLKFLSFSVIIAMLMSLFIA